MKKIAIRLYWQLYIVTIVTTVFGFAEYSFSHGEDSHQNQSVNHNAFDENYVVEYSDYKIPDVMFYDQNAQSVSISELFSNDRPIVLNFVFTSCPTICPVLTSTFSKLQTSFENEQPAVQLVSVSIDPEHDTPSVLRGYAAKFNANPNWTFLTGSSNDIVLLQKAFDSFRGDKMSHAPVFFMRAAASERWLRIEGFPSIKNIESEFRRLKDV